MPISGQRKQTGKCQSLGIRCTKEGRGRMLMREVRFIGGVRAEMLKRKRTGTEIAHWPRSSVQGWGTPRKRFSAGQVRVEHGDRRYQGISHPAGSQGRALSPRGQLQCRTLILRVLRKPSQLTKKKTQRNVRIILAAVIEKPPSYSASTCENFSFAQINFKPSILVC